MLFTKTFSHIQAAFTGLVSLASVRSGSGEVGGAKTSAVTKRWHPVSMLDANSAGNASNAQIAFDGHGNAMAVWSSYDGISYNICVVKFVPGLGWGEIHEMLTDNPAVVYSPQIAINEDGHAVVVWSNFDGVRSVIWANTYVPGSGWGAAICIEANDNASYAETPKVAIDTYGNAIVLWRRYDLSQRSIWANRFEPGAGWLTPTLIESNTLGDTESPQIAMHSNGCAMAVWRRCNGKQTDIWINDYTLNMGWGTARPLNARSVGDAYEPQIAISDSGSAIVVWRQSDGTGHKVWFSRYTHDTKWDASQAIEIDHTWQAFEPQIAMHRSGSAIAVWCKSNIGISSVWASSYTPNTGWSIAQMISGDSNANKAQIRISANGTAMAIWHQADEKAHVICANRFEPGKGWGQAIVFKSTLTGRADLPQIAMNDSGDAIAVWQQLNGLQENILTSVYCA
jgi:hypothetical protein